MAIEESLERIATALETLVAAGTGPATTTESEKPTRSRRKKKEEAPAAAAPATEPEAKAETPDPPSSETPMVTRDAVREALRIFRKDHSKEDAIAILGEHGAKSITAADESVLPALLEAFTA